MHQQANKTPLQGESGEFVRGTTWTFEDGPKNSDQCHIYDTCS